MATNVTFNGTTYSVPALGDTGWAAGAGNLSSYLIAIASGTLQTTGGNFTLSAPVNFGSGFGILAKNFNTVTASPATAGVLNLALTDTICWGPSNLSLGISGGNLTFNGSQILITLPIILTSQVSGVLPVANGGTNLSSYVANELFYASGSGVMAQLATANNGVLVTSGGGVPSIGSTLPAAVQGNITAVGTVASGVWNGSAVPAANGGTGKTTLTAHGVVVGQGTSAVNVTAAGTSGQPLLSGGASADPAYGTLGTAFGGTGAAANYAQGAVVMFPTNPSLTSSNAWTIIAPDGTTVSQVGTTTSGLQEAINYAVNNGYPLRVYGRGGTSGGTNAVFILATSQITVPPAEQWSCEFHDVNLTFANTVNVAGFVFDSCLIVDFKWEGGQIVYQPATPTSNSIAVEFSPRNPVSIDNITTVSASKFFISNVAVPASNGQAQAVVGFNVSLGSIVSNLFGFCELNGTGTGNTANTNYGILVFGAASNTAFEQNIIDACDIHITRQAGVQIALSSTNQANYRQNIWRISDIKPSGDGITLSDGFNSFGSNDCVTLGGLTNEEGTLDRGIVLQSGATGNNFTVGKISGTTTHNTVNSGSSNTLIYNGAFNTNGSWPT